MKLVYIKFRTPSLYRLRADFDDIWDRWRNNQWVVLHEFRKAKISVDVITVEINHHDMSGLVRVTHNAEHIDKYATLADDNLWLRKATVYQNNIQGTGEWVKVD